MAKVRQRAWKVPGQRTKRKAWGFVTVDDAGKQVRCFKAEWTEKDAESALAEYVLKIEQKTPAAGTGITLSQAAERYLLAKARKRTVAEDRRQLGHLKTAFGADTPLAAITAGHISEYKAGRLGAVRKVRDTERHLSAAAVNRPLALLRHLLRLAHEEWGELAAVPKIRTEKEPQGRLRWLTEAEAVSVLAACRKSRNPALADLVEFSLFTGVRRGEALGLTWDRVDRSRGVIRLELTKSGRRREVPLSSNADAVLARRWTDGAKGYVFGSCKWNSFRSAWEAALAAAGIEGFRFHDLRHTFASWLVQRGRSLQEVKEALGHETITMTMRYSHLAPEHLRAAIAVLDGVLPAVQRESAARITQEITHEVVPASEVLQKSS
jgi:integrase